MLPFRIPPSSATTFNRAQTRDNYPVIQSERSPCLAFSHIQRIFLTFFPKFQIYKANCELSCWEALSQSVEILFPSVHMFGWNKLLHKFSTGLDILAMTMPRSRAQQSPYQEKNDSSCLLLSLGLCITSCRSCSPATSGDSVVGHAVKCSNPESHCLDLHPFSSLY